jgi:RNA polymerase sigma factor (sigma-70 family)
MAKPLRQGRLWFPNNKGTTMNTERRHTTQPVSIERRNPLPNAAWLAWQKPRMVALLLSIGAIPDDAEEATQMAGEWACFVLKVYQHTGKAPWRLPTDPPDCKKPHHLHWLMNHARNALRRIYFARQVKTVKYWTKVNRERFAKQEGAELLSNKTQPHPIDNLIAAEQRVSISKALPSLPPTMRAVLELRLEGYTNNQIAEAAGVSKGTASTAYSQAIKLLKGKIIQPY